MSILLYVAGALFVVVGAALIGFGIPINEFSFGNTLIIAGMVAMVGGLIVLALGVVVRELRHVANAYARAAVRPARPPEPESMPPMRTAPPAAARVPFPPKPKSASPAETLPRELVAPFAPEPRDEPPSSRDDLPPPFPVRRTMSTPVAAPVPRPQEEVFGAPSLPNPAEVSEFERYDETRSTMVEQPQPSEAEAEEAAELAEAGEWDDAEKTAAATEAVEAERPLFAPTRRGGTPSPTAVADKPERSYFDAMWPADPETPKAPDVKLSRVDLPEPTAEPEVEKQEPPVEEPRTVPILKSGVVDGMGYTLYVDGSIEAELPQGTLRFASINELRAHLEKTS